MTQDGFTPIDPNTADPDVLCQLSGVGPAMAQRIIAARPFETIEDLTRVRGIGPAAVQRWAPHLALAAGAFQPPPSEQGLGDADDVAAGVEYVQAKVAPVDLVEVEPDIAALESIEPSVEVEVDLPEIEPIELATEAEGDTTPVSLSKDSEDHRPEPSKAAPSSRQRRTPVVTRGYVGWLVTVGGLLVLVLSLALSLGILATLNDNQLQFVYPAQISAAGLRIEELEARADTLEQDVDGLRTRLSNLEAMGERMSAVEQAAEALRTDIDAAAAGVEDLSTQLGTVEDDLSTVSEQMDDLQTEIGTLQTQSERVQAFLDGLKALMDTLFRTEGGQ